jgi:hypothetical protein
MIFCFMDFRCHYYLRKLFLTCRIIFPLNVFCVSFSYIRYLVDIEILFIFISLIFLLFYVYLLTTLSLSINRELYNTINYT